MCLHTERGGDTPKAACVDNSPRRSFAVTETQKLVAAETLKKMKAVQGFESESAFQHKTLDKRNSKGDYDYKAR